ncbi:hypothetical protein D3C80_2061800 [compost metagenome]
MVTSTVRIRNGDQALRICPKLYGDGVLPRGPEKPPMTAAPPDTLTTSRSAARVGCQTLRNSVSETILTSAEVMSGSSGPM